MAEYNGNAICLRMNAINVESLWKNMEISQSIGDEDVTAGAGAVWEEHAGKLRGASAKITLAYNDTQAATDMAALYTANSVIAVVYGPEGSTVGKPCDSRSWLVTGVSGPSTNVEKSMVVLEFDLVATGTPTKNIFAGETF